MIEFLSQSDMTYTKYEVSGQCLFRKVGWWVKDLLDIINGSELHSSNFVSIFLEKLTFSQLYDFIKSHKQFVYDKNIFYTSCLCDNCKNIVFLGLKVWTIINDSQLQLVFPKHRMILLKNTAVHLMTKIVCLKTVQNVHLENYTSYLIPTLIQNLISILILILIQAAWYLSNAGENPISMLPKYPPVSHFYHF